MVWRETRSAYLFCLPALIFFVGFVIIPMVLCLVTSFFKYTMGEFSFIGVQNYITMFQDKIFLVALKNTILIVVVAVPSVTAFSLWVGASIYNMKAVPRSIFRCIFYLPVVTGSVAVAVVWKWMFSKYNGLFNTLLLNAGVVDKEISWLGDERFALWCIILILFTTSIGQPIVLYVAALGNVDASLVEAAEVDGATKMQTFWKIKWAAIMPTTLYIVIITTINSFQCYALIQLLTSGGPNHKTETIMFYIYYQAFKLNNYGFGNAMGIFLAIVIAIFSAIQLKLGQSKE